MGVVEAMRQPMTLQTNTNMIMREQARRYLASKWPLFTVFVFITVIVKSLRGDGANWPYLLITTNTLFFQLSNRTLDLNKLLMLKEITKIQERKELYLVISSLYAEIVPVFQTVRDRHTLTVDSLKIGETGRENSSGLYLLSKWCVFFFAAKDVKRSVFQYELS